MLLREQCTSFPVTIFKQVLLCLFNYIDLITSLDIPRSVQIHVRAKNVNGWSQWSNFGYVMDIHTDCRWNNDLFVWLYYHSLEQYYNRVVEFGVTSIEELVKMSSNDIGSMQCIGSII